ncbi:hypothetical protein DUI87_11258 [Hirundo rustica rustica]|uniref:Uncharacterized protein n=1 Tax=Hirundo rustica rustica TaxID=333673 RepID=A0A3M0KFY8_HIRRU|nr:hypothetical protein DUI87_11258 [Hirundo rustica rustica]
MDGAEEEGGSVLPPGRTGASILTGVPGKTMMARRLGGVLLVKNCQGHGDDTGLAPIDDLRFCTILPG